MGPPRFELLEQALSEIDRNVETLSAQPIVVFENGEKYEDEPDGRIWNRLKTTQKWELYTNFNENQLLHLYRLMTPRVYNYRRRGPLPKISDIDSLIIWLTFYKTGLEFEKLADFVGVKITCMKNAIERMRNILYNTLYEVWLANPHRLKPIPNTHYPYIALLVDSMSTQVFRPKAQFQEAKIYWD